MLQQLHHPAAAAAVAGGDQAELLDRLDCGVKILGGKPKGLGRVRLAGLSACATLCKHLLLFPKPPPEPSSALASPTFSPWQAFKSRQACSCRREDKGRIALTFPSQTAHQLDVLTSAGHAAAQERLMPAVQPVMIDQHAIYIIAYIICGLIIHQRAMRRSCVVLYEGKCRATWL